ncbi:MAG: Multidrug transporter MdfA [Pseudomonadota bacterium]|jgi:DHA1 family multidrug/chloramphenicol efflux transport protein-like MFS transporter
MTTETTEISLIDKKILWLFPLCLILYELPLYFATNMYLPALPAVCQTFKISASLAQLTIAIWFLGASCFQIFLGPLADYYGRRQILLSSGIFFVIASIICAITHYIVIFVVARFIQGCVVSSILVTGYATIHELLDTEQAIKTLAWMGGVTVLAPAIGPFFGSFLISIFSWRNIFFLLAIIAALALYTLYLYMPETQTKKIHLSYKTTIRNFKIVSLNKRFLYFTLPFCFLFAAMMCWDTFSPFYIINYLGFSAFYFGIIQAIVYGGFIIGTHLTRMLIGKINFIVRYALINILLFFFLVVFSLFFIPNRENIVLFFLTFFTLNTGLVFYVLHGKAIESVEAPMGIKMVVFSTAMNLFGFLGSLIASKFHF